MRTILRHVALHVVVLHEPQAEAHQRHEDGDDDLTADVGRHEVIGDIGIEHRGLGELQRGGLIKSAQRGTFAAGDVWNGRQRVEHAHEYRALNQHRQTRTHRVRVVVLIQLHHFTLHGLFAGLIVFALVFVLDARHLRLDFLHFAHRLHGLVVQREHARMHHEHQEDDG